MKAVVWEYYGSADKLSFKEVARPKIKENEILIQVYASTVTAGDCEIRALKFPLFLKLMLRLYFGIIRPKDAILGQELSGKVVEVGSKVTKFSVGDAVFGSSGMKLGGYGEYVALPETTSMGIIVKKPEFIDYNEAAAMPVGGMEALHILKKCKLSNGDSLLINGAGGSIGTIALQIAKHQGAHVTCVDSQEKLKMLKDLGSDRVIDYRSKDYTEEDETYDVIIDIVGKSKIIKSFGVLKPMGRYLIANPRMRHRLLSKLKFFSDKKMIVSIANHTEDAMNELIDLYKQSVIKIEIDKIYPLNAVAQAHQYVEDSKKKGNVVIRVKESI